MDQQSVNNTVYEMLRARVENNKAEVTYADFIWRFYHKCGIELDANDYIRKILHEYIHELLIDKILMLVPGKHDFQNEKGLLTFQITSYGAKCIREGVIKPASPNLYTLFDSLELHPWVVEVSEPDFKSGHYDQAIFEACKMIANKVKERSGLDSDGQKLMMDAFRLGAPPNPVLALNDLTTTADKDEQEGFQFIFAGIMRGVRNPSAHDEPKIRDPYETLHYLAFASILAHKIEKAKVRT